MADARVGREHRARPRPATQILTGAGLGWIVLPLLVFCAAEARGSGGLDQLAWVIAGGSVAAGTGLFVGLGRLGWSGLGGVIGGELAGALFTYLVIPPLHGLTIWGLDIYGEYVPGMVAAGFVAGIGTTVGARSRIRVPMRPAPIVTLGLVVLALWLGFWFVVAPSLGRAA